MNIFTVLGMPRSGTSVIARGLQALGIDFGNRLLSADPVWNAKGFWEDEEIVYKINRRLLPIHDIENQNDSQISAIKQNAQKLLGKRMASTDYWGFKDPRTAQLLPFWQEVFKNLNLKEHYVIALRNPLSSAASYQSLSGCDIEQGFLIWLKHLLPSINGTQHKKRIIVSYERMLTNPENELYRIKHAFNLPLAINQQAMDCYIKEFLDKDLQRYVNTDQDFQSHPALEMAPACLSAYALLLKTANDELSLESQEFTLAWHDIQALYDKYKPNYTYIDNLINKNKTMMREIRTIKKSLPWKIIYPLTLIDNYLRNKRRARRKITGLMP